MSMEGREIYLVVGDIGEYSNHEHWVLATWTSAAAAARHVALADQMRQRLAAGLPLTADDVAIDPDLGDYFRNGVSMTNSWRVRQEGMYTVEAVRLDPHLPGFAPAPGGEA